MRARLRSQLYDVEDETWSAGEKDDVLLWSVRKLNKRLNRPLDPEATAQNITLVTDTYFYAIDSTITSVVRVDLYNSSGDALGPLEAGWETVGDLVTGNGKLHLSPTTVEATVGGSVRMTAYGRYELLTQASSQTSANPDDYITLVLSTARAEAYRRLVSDRARFRQWQTNNQVQNISVNELIQMVTDADRQAEDEWAYLKRWQKPVIGRI